MDDFAVNARILFVDDETAILNSLRRAVRPLGAECVFVEGGHRALQLLKESPFDVVVSDMRMPEIDGATMLAEVARLYPEVMRLVLSGYSEDELIMAAINEGRIWGFIHKPWEDNQLLVTLRQAIATQQMMVERALLRRSLTRYNRSHDSGFCRFIGSSLAMQTVYNQIERAAPSNASVFITGPSGTGKELAAQAIHELSARGNEPFIALNCAAIPAELMESEIFGHVKGAFSGAVSSREGAAAQANGGTLFLDELGEMDIALQAKLLRFIQTGSYQKVGGSRQERVDIRFVCATNRSPLEAISKGLLREDLYYRLNVVSLHLPALSEREQDCIQLARHFLAFFTEREGKELVDLSQDAIDLLQHYSWPGNVRQLENTIYSAVVMSAGPLITSDDLSLALRLEPEEKARLLSGSKTQIQDSQSPNVSLPGDENVDFQLRPLAHIEREYIELAINACEGNVVRAASALRVSPSTLYRKIQSWEAPSR